MDTREVFGLRPRFQKPAGAVALTAAILIMMRVAPLQAASGTWTGTQDAAWVNSANWSATPYPSGNETATFNGPGNGNTDLSVAGLGSILNITFTGASVAAYTVGSPGQKVTLLAGGTVRLSGDAANSQTVQTDIELPTGNSSVTFQNDTPAQTLTLGKVHGYMTAGATKSVYVKGSGSVTLQGDLDRYLSGLLVYHQTTNVLAMNGNVQLTQLFLDGTNAIATVGPGKVMTFSNTGGYNILASQDSVINGPGAIVLSTNTGDDHANNAVATGKTLTINAKLTGDTGFQFWHDTYYGTIVLNGVNDYTRSTVINVPGTLQFSAIGNRGVAGNLGAGTNIVLDHASCRFRYTGSGETTDRIFDVKIGGIFEHAGSGSLTFTSPTASSTSGNKTFTIRNFAAASGAFSGAVQNGAGIVALAKEGDGTWSLSASNTFSGTLFVREGTLLLTGANGSVATASCTVSNGATLLLDNTAAANHTNRLADTCGVTLLGGTLRLAHDAGDADFSETFGALTAGLAACTVQTDPAAEGRSATLTLGALARANGATLNFVGSGLGANGRNSVFITAQPEGPLPAWVTLNGQPAYYSATGGVTPAPAWDVAEIAARGPDSVIPDSATADVRITQPGTDGPVTLAGDPVTGVAYLRQCSDTAATVDTANRTLRAHVVAITNGQAALNLGLAVGDGAVAPLTPGGTLDLDNASISALTLKAALADNTTASSVMKNGTGDVVIAGPVFHTGTTAINEGALTFAGHTVTQRLAGAVAGSGTLVKTGTNLLDLAAASAAFTGPVLIQQGIVRVHQSGALGTAAAGTVIADGATLNLGGAATADTLNLGQEPVTAQGAGADGQGAIVNRSAYQQIYALGNVELTGGTTLGGTARWDIRNGTLKLNGHAVTKSGPSTVCLSGTTAVTPGGDAAGIDVLEGTFRLQQSVQMGGSALNTLRLRGGTTIDFYDLIAAPAWSLTCDDDTRYRLSNSSAATQNSWAGPVTLNGTLYLTGAGTFNGGFAGPVSGSGSLFKTNDHNFYITGTDNTYSGPTTVAGGWLYVNSIRNVGQPSALGQPATVADGTIRIGSAGTPGRLVYRGTGDVSDRVIDMYGTTGWTTLGHEGTGPLVYSNLTVSTPGAKLLYLIGNSTSTAEVVSAVVNSPSGNVSLEKQNTGTWILSGDCTYSGTTAIQDGRLVFKGSNTLGGNLEARNGRVTILGTNTHGPSAAIYIGNINNGVGVLNLPAGARLSCANNFRVGGAASSHGAFYIDGGSFTNAQVAGEQSFNFGSENLSYGYLLMTGGTVNAGRLQTGGYSSGTAYGTSVLRVKGGSLHFPEWVILGRRRGAKCAVTLDGGTFTRTSGNELALCRNGGDSEINLTGGTLNNTEGPLTFHSQSTEGTGVVNLCAGRLNTRTFRNDGGAAYLMLSGGTLAPSIDTAVFVPANMTGVYAFGAFGVFAGGAVIDTAGRAVTIPASIRAPTGLGVVSIALASSGSGYIGEPYVVIEGDGVGATAVADLTDDGKGKGTFKLAGITVTSPGVNYTTPPTVTLLGGGTNIQQAVVGTVALGANSGGGLTKTGAGTLTLSGTNTYSGATTLTEGTLVAASADALPPGTDLVLENGLLDLGGFAQTNGAVTATAGIIANGTLSAGRFTKAGDGLLTLAVPLATDAPVLVEGGTLRLVNATPGLYEGPLSGSFNTTEPLSTNILIQLTTRMANANTKPPWSDYVTYLYTGYIWNRTENDVTWTFGENIDDSTLLKIDGITVLNNGVHNKPTIGTITLAPGPHTFEARFGNGSGGAGRYVSEWWTTSAFGFGIDFQGRNDTNIANFVALSDPGDGSLLTTGFGNTSNWLAVAASVDLASSATLDLGGTVQTLSGLSGSGTVSNGTLTVTGDILPGGDGTIGTLTVSGGNLLASGTLRIDVAAGGLCDRLDVNGNADLTGLNLVIANPEALSRTQVYTLLTCSGTRTGTFSSVTVPDSRWHTVYRSDGSVQLLFLRGTLIRLR